MDLFMVLQLLCGLALFLFGMNSMGDGLESLSGGKLEKTLEKMTNSTMKGFILGAAVTAVIQSSSATTVMVVGFVNSGIMKLRQAIGIIMGIDRILDMTRTAVNITGDAVCTTIVAKQNDALDRDIFYQGEQKEAS
mgnify:CR=1 FL=1